MFEIGVLLYFILFTLYLYVNGFSHQCLWLETASVISLRILIHLPFWSSNLCVHVHSRNGSREVILIGVWKQLLWLLLVFQWLSCLTPRQTFPWYNISQKSCSQDRPSKLSICYMWHCILNPDMEDCDFYDFQDYILESIFYHKISNKKTGFIT